LARRTKGGEERLPRSRAGAGRRHRPVSSRRRPEPAVLLIGSRTFEVKPRTRGLRQLYQWLGDRHFGVIVATGTEEPLLVVRLGDFLRNCAFRESAQERRPKSLDSVCLPRVVSGPA